MLFPGIFSSDFSPQPNLDNKQSVATQSGDVHGEE